MIRTVFALLLGTVPLAAKTSKYRLVWRDDPSTTVCVQWCQEGGKYSNVLFSETDHGGKLSHYEKQKTPDRVQEHQGMVHHFARLTGLKPDTAYYFIVRDSDGASERMWFRTAPAERKPFTFVIGGDCRNSPEPRQKCNRIVPLLRPLFVAFGGDYTDRCVPDQWKEFLDDWALTKASDGRMFPLLPARGNHEKSNAEMFNIFDVPDPDNYYALSFGGDLLRFYTLNSESGAEGEQAAWLEYDLATHFQTARHLVTNYNKPMRPAVKEKGEVTPVYRAWAKLFYRFGVDLAVESDSPSGKRSKAVKPSSEPHAEEGFVTDSNGTFFIGEGSWGAPLRPANDPKSKSSDGSSFHGFDWVHVHPDRLEVKTVQTEASRMTKGNSDASPMATPEGLVLWDAPNTGTTLVIPYRVPLPVENLAQSLKPRPAKVAPVEKPPVEKPVVETVPQVKPPKPETVAASPKENVLIKPASIWRYTDTRELPSPVWFENSFLDSDWTSGPAPLGYGDKTVKTTLDFGKDKSKKRLTAWFRRSFVCADPSAFVSIKGSLLRDDGARIYLNGKEILNENLPGGPIDEKTLALKRTPSDDNRIWVEFSFAATLLKPGANQVAVEIHQASASSEDLIFDLQLTGVPK